MFTNTNRWLWGGAAVVALALLLTLAVTLVWDRQGVQDAVTPSATELAWSAGLPLADTIAAHSGMDPRERLEPPVMSDPPTQIEVGHLGYWTSCMACHGDRGQGLTEEWRTMLAPMDTDCWKSGCHGPNHPPEGFEIPRTSLMVTGAGALTDYETADDLFQYLKTAMPLPSPGLFKDDQYWGLTAYVLDANNVDLGKPLRDHEQCENCASGGTCDCERVKEPLGPENASEILIAPGLVQTHKTAFETEQIATAAMVGLLLCAAVAFWVIRAI